MGEWLHPWTIEPCDLCGCEHTLTRGDGRERSEEELCVACSERAEGYDRGRAAGIAEERARVVAWLERVGAQLSAFHAFAGGALMLEAAHIRDGEHMPETGGEE